MIVPDWDEKYSVHNKRIDRQHQKLFEIAKQAEELLRKQSRMNDIKMILTKLFNYMRFHFKDEEVYMEKIGYPILPDHRRLHQDIVDKMIQHTQNMQGDFKKKLAVITHDWLVEHIMQEDVKIERWREGSLILKPASAKELEDSPAVKPKPEAVIKTAPEPVQKTVPQKIKHYYKCGCRRDFTVPEEIHNNIMQGKKFHCKKCRMEIVFIMDKIV